MYFLYSSKVVAPIVLISPLASIGFNKFAASIAPSDFPAPTKVWISSINIMILPSDSATSFRTAFNLSSNSPLNFAPAIKLPMSNAKIDLFLKVSGTSSLTILRAKPSTIAVLPTPGWPINTGLFFVLRLKILTLCLISSSRPITGSSFPSFAKSVKLRPYFVNTSVVSSGLSESTFWFPLKSFKLDAKFCLLILKSFNKTALTVFFSPKILIKMCSTDTKLSPIDLASSSAFNKILWKAVLGYTLDWLSFLGRESIFWLKALTIFL